MYDKRQDIKIIWLNRFALMTIVLAFLVLGLGAFTRLMDAGLGCPDWPGCYGHLVVPTHMPDLQAQKAWAEMVHRYFAGTLALCIMGVAMLCIVNAVRYGAFYLCMALLIFLLVMYQALLGMWTVTLKLHPLVVTQHLIGGLSLLVLLWLIYLKSRKKPLFCQSPARFKIFAASALLLVFLQILLGAWTSTNYAALSCPAFPGCQTSGVLFPFSFDAFRFLPFSTHGVNYEGGVLSEAARQAIHMTHRLGAVVVSVYLIIFSVCLGKKEAVVLLFLLVLQLSLGFLNVWLALPLWSALLHHMTAALLLLWIVACNFYMWTGEKA